MCMDVTGFGELLFLPDTNYVNEAVQSFNDILIIFAKQSLKFQPIEKEDPSKMV